MIKYTTEKTMFGINPVSLTFIPANMIPYLSDPIITSVHILPLRENQVLLTKNQRGFDIIGGHVETGEHHTEALCREAMEEAYIELHDYELLGYIQVDNSDNPRLSELPYPRIGYQAFYISRSFTEHPFDAAFESSERCFIHINDMSTHHHHWLQTHQQMLNHINALSTSNDFTL